jgi:hypothetical protein
VEADQKRTGSQETPAFMPLPNLISQAFRVSHDGKNTLEKVSLAVTLSLRAPHGVDMSSAPATQPATRPEDGGN